MKYLTDDEFNLVYSLVPRLTVDLLIESQEGLLLSLRSIEPYMGEWHLPGRTVYIDESIDEASVRVAKRETGLDVVFKKSIGHMEFPNEVRGLVTIRTVSLVVVVEIIGGILQPDEFASELKWFKFLPANIISQHGKFLLDSGTLMSA